MSTRAISLVVIACALQLAVQGQSSRAIEKIANSTIGSPAYLRAPDANSELHFNSTGTLLAKTSACAWTVCAILMPEHFRVDGNALVISGDRAVAIYDRESKSLVPLPVSRKLSISIDLPADPSQLPSTLAKIFDSSDMSSRLRDYWRPTGAADRASPESDCIVGLLDGKPVYQIGCPGIKSSKPIYTPSPEYTELAQKNGISAGDVLSVVLDEQGQPEVIEIKKKAGAGLDIQSVEAISQWKFAPGLRNGVPVPFLTSVETDYSLFPRLRGH